MMIMKEVCFLKEITLYLPEEFEMLIVDSQDNGIECSDLVNEIILDFYGKKNDLESMLFQNHYETVEAFLAGNHIDFIDNRNKGGALWLVDSPRARIAVLKANKLYNIKFEYSKEGGRSTKRQSAWYLANENNV